MHHSNTNHSHTGSRFKQITYRPKDFLTLSRNSAMNVLQLLDKTLVAFTIIKQKIYISYNINTSINNKVIHLTVGEPQTN